MEKRVYNECCYRMLSLLNVLKDSLLQRAELENILHELNRLIRLATTEQEIPLVEIEELTEKKYRVKNTVIEEEGEVRITSTDILGLLSYYKEIPLKSQPIEKTVEYVKTIYENRICMACLRRASANTLIAPLVVKKIDNTVTVYHIECAEGRQINRELPHL